MYNINVNKKTIRKYFSTNRMEEVLWYGRGKQCIGHDNFLSVMDSAIISYIQLSNVGMKAQPNLPGIIRKMELCLKKGGYAFSRGGALYDRMMSRQAD